MDKSMLADLESLPEEDKVRMSTIIEQPQIREMFYRLCGHLPTEILDQARRRMRRCANKFLKHSMRVGTRFAELNQGATTTN